MTKLDALLHKLDTDCGAICAAVENIKDAMLTEIVFDDALKDLDEIGELILDLEEMKAMVKLLAEALNEQIERRKAEMNHILVANDKPYWPIRGKKLALHVQHFYSPAGGSGNPVVAAWFKEHGRGDVVKESIHPQTFSAAIKEIIEENGGELPGDLEPLVKDSEKPTVRITSD